MIRASGPILTAEQMRAAEQQSDVALDVLMERAGAALADAVWRFGGGAPALVLCGSGNNGGDGYVAARILAERGLSVRIAATGPSTVDPARGMAERWTGPIEEMEGPGAPVIVDCLFGSGVNRPLPDSVQAELRRLRASAQMWIAADLPSGVSADCGNDWGAVRADVTVAFAALKPAHLLFPAAALCGTVLLADIGIKVASQMQVIARPTLASPNFSDHKYRRGYVVVVTGAMAGAAILSSEAALRAGAGYVVRLGDGAPAHARLSAIIDRVDDLERQLADDRIGAVVIGPGLGREADSAERVRTALASDRALVLDADALHLTTPAALQARTAPVILTPHDGEFAALFPGIEGDRIESTRAAARACGHVVVRKGPATIVAAPDGRIGIGYGARHWLATAGTGDVLAGICGAMLARRLCAFDAACAAVWLHGEAARLVGPAMVADDLIAALPQAVTQCR